MLEVMRKMKVYLNGYGNFQVGDQIQVGRFYTATCQKVGKNGAVFLFDQYLEEAQQMNKIKNSDGYLASDLRMYLKGFALNSMFDDFRGIMVPFKNGDLLRIPMAEEIFDPDEVHKSYEDLSCKEQWPLMKMRKNRLTYRGEQEKTEWGWLQNRLRDHPSLFGTANSTGSEINYNNQISHNGVRVVFRLKSKGDI